MLGRKIKQDKKMESAMEGPGSGDVILYKWPGKASPKGSEEEKNPVLLWGKHIPGPRNGSAKALGRQHPG